MKPDAWFASANGLAQVAWLCLAVGLVAAGLRRRHAALDGLAQACLLLGGRVLPALLALGYALAIGRWLGEAQGGFDSLAGVERLFETRGVVLAGWLHFLAFDLWVGRWQVDRLEASLNTRANGPRGAREWAWRCAALPCLFCTFMLGPVGLLLFLALLALRRALHPHAAIA